MSLRLLETGADAKVGIAHCQCLPIPDTGGTGAVSDRNWPEADAAWHFSARRRRRYGPGPFCASLIDADWSLLPLGCTKATLKCLGNEVLFATCHY